MRGGYGHCAFPGVCCSGHLNKRKNEALAFYCPKEAETKIRKLIIIFLNAHNKKELWLFVGF